MHGQHHYTSAAMANGHPEAKPLSKDYSRSRQEGSGIIPGRVGREVLTFSFSLSSLCPCVTEEPLFAILGGVLWKGLAVRIRGGR